MIGVVWGPDRAMRSRLLTAKIPFPAILAVRYLWSARKDAFSTFLSAVAVCAITLGVAALILSLAALSGFQQVLRSQILAHTPDAEVELPATGADAEGARRAADVARSVEGVEAVHQVVRGRGWLAAAGRVSSVELVGFEGGLPPSFPDPTGGEANGETGLWISRRLAESWFLEGGDVVEVISPRPTLTPVGPQPRVRSVRLAGVYEGGTVSEQERAALPLDVAESLFGKGRRLLLVSFGGPEAGLDAARRLEAVLPDGARVSTWRDLNRPLFFALRLERIFLFLGVSLIVLVAALALLADLALIIANKRADVGMLLTLGSTPERLRRAFLLLGALLATAGTALGTGVGVGLALLLDRLRLLRLPGDVFFVEHVPFLVRPGDLVLVLVVTLVLALGSSFYGAHKAASLDPVELLRR